MDKTGRYSRLAADIEAGRYKTYEGIARAMLDLLRAEAQDERKSAPGTQTAPAPE